MINQWSIKGVGRFWLITLLATCGQWVSVMAQDYPAKPLTMVVAFGFGGSADRMTRAMSSAVSSELGQPVHVINKKGAGTLFGANYVLSQPHDGYTIFANTFSPYLINTILEGNAKYAVDDFAYLNFQWFDEDLIALNKDSEFRDLPELLKTIRDKPKTLKASVVRGSAGHLMIKLLLEVNCIPQSNLNLVTYNSGGQARAAVAGGVVDFIVISAKGSETIREYLRPLAIVSHHASEEWNVPAINEAIKPMGIEVPVLPGSVRGFATTAEFKRQFPERFQVLVSAVKSALENEALQTELEAADIGGRWMGPEESEAMMQASFDTFKDYSYLLKL
ncbi:MAG: tripartite tricarboxylate transporter substrate binding protein [Opitutales bacterium]|nr:tripartite tricarboxylate transporter substrate binding protein [Opitutales bacterium]